MTAKSQRWTPNRLALQIADLQGSFHVLAPVSYLLIAGANAVQIVAGNPQRWAFLLALPGAGPVYVSPNPAFTGLDGGLVQNTSFWTIMKFSDVGALVNVPWYAIATIANAQLNVIEVIIQT